MEEQRGYTSAAKTVCKIPLPMKIEKFYSGVSLYHFSTVLKAFQRHSL
jgi:hypothetical protein